MYSNMDEIMFKLYSVMKKQTSIDFKIICDYIIVS